MTELEKYQAVNACKNIHELVKIIRSFADASGMIQGRTRVFDAGEMARKSELWYEGCFGFTPNVATREFGIRQQLMYIKYYKKL
jgi:hypothetical protein